MKAVLRSVIATMAATLIAASAAQPATAGGSNGGSNYYSWGCVQGTLDGWWEDASGGSNLTVVPAHVAPCLEPLEDSVFAVAVYNADGTAFGYVNHMPRLPRAYNTLSSRRTANTVAICLLGGFNERIDCLDVTGDFNVHLPVNDPRVSIPAVVDMEKKESQDPICPTCLE